MALLLRGGFGAAVVSYTTCRGFNSLPLHFCCNYIRNTSMKKPPKATETTSKRVASIASGLLSNPKTPAKVKSVAASALTQKVKKTK